MQNAFTPCTAPIKHNPREVEAALLLEGALRLQDAQSRPDKAGRRLSKALTHNQRLWGAFLASIASADHPLPCEIRHTIANLGLFVRNETAAIASDPRPEHLSALIWINRELAAGLLGRA